jgi:molecular chaperone DnaJ
VTLDFLEAVHGVPKTIKLYTNAPCSVCQGTGAEPGAEMESCKTCNGQGRTMRATRTIFGTVQTAVTCSECNGTGKRPSKICKHCSGGGIERKSRELKIEIPGGLDDGEAIKVTGEGEYPGSGGKAGDLYVRVRVKSHPTFSREGFDVLSILHLPFTTLSLGGEVALDTVDGSGTLKIPEGTQPGTIFKLRGKGFKYLRGGGRGDHLVTVESEVPHKPSREQRKALEDLRKLGL